MREYGYTREQIAAARKRGLQAGLRNPNADPARELRDRIARNATRTERMCRWPFCQRLAEDCRGYCEPHHEMKAALAYETSQEAER